MAAPPLLFDAARIRAHRDRAASAGFADFLHARAAEDLAERLEAVNRAFGAGLAIGAPGFFAQALAARPALAARVGPLFQMDLAAALVARGRGVAADSERLPFAAQSFGLIVSTLALHWTNDLIGALTQARLALRPDGLFLAALFGGRTLEELRACLLEAELDVRSGAGPRVSPFADAFDIAQALQRAGFALPVADSDVLTVRYEHPLRLIADLRAMGESNALVARAGKPLTRAILARAIELYQARYSENGRVRATFEIVTATGWAPDESQQKPLKPGSAKARLADALGAVEHKLPDKAG
ncbi:MAG: methyltransferase domain-containing protein [Hyphomonadaceae bacterium]